jgi:hypothetical protein
MVTRLAECAKNGDNARLRTEALTGEEQRTPVIREGRWFAGVASKQSYSAKMNWRTWSRGKQKLVCKLRLEQGLPE